MFKKIVIYIYIHAYIYICTIDFLQSLYKKDLDVASNIFIVHKTPSKFAPYGYEFNCVVSLLFLCAKPFLKCFLQKPSEISCTRKFIFLNNFSGKATSRHQTTHASIQFSQMLRNLQFSEHFQTVQFFIHPAACAYNDHRQHFQPTI